MIKPQRTDAEPRTLTPLDVQQIGELWETINRILDASPDLMKNNSSGCNISIDARQRLCNTPHRIERGGVPMDFVAYYRVSTKKQGRSGLGLEAQQAAVADHVKHEAGRLLKEFREVESGKRSDRPELLKAIAHARRCGATLVVAKLDRLSRNVAFLSALMESGVDFVCCDNPNATKFTVHILAAVAEWEREAISKRTREALAQAKVRGVKLGTNNPKVWTPELKARRREWLGKARTKAAASVSRKAVDEYSDITPLIQSLHIEGQSLREIAERLNTDGYTTRRGKAFEAVTVQRILKRSK